MSVRAGELSIQFSDGSKRTIPASRLAAMRQFDKGLTILQYGGRATPSGVPEQGAADMLKYQLQGTKALHDASTDPGVLSAAATLPLGGEGIPMSLARLGVGAAVNAAATKARGGNAGNAALWSLAFGAPLEALSAISPAVAKWAQAKWLGKTPAAAPSMPEEVLAARQVLRGPGAATTETSNALRAGARDVRGMVAGGTQRGLTVPREKLFESANKEIAAVREASPSLAEAPQQWVDQKMAELPEQVPIARVHAWKRAMQRVGKSKFSEMTPGALSVPELAKLSSQDARMAADATLPGYNAANEKVQALMFGRKAVQTAQTNASAPRALIDPLTKVSLAGAGMGTVYGHPQGFAVPAATFALHAMDNPYFYNRLALTASDPALLAAMRTIPRAVQSPIVNRLYPQQP